MVRFTRAGTLRIVLAGFLLLTVACTDAESVAVRGRASSGSQDPSTTSAPITTTTTVPVPEETAATTTSTSTTSTTTTTIPPLEPPTFASVEGINTIREFSGYTSRGLARWQQSVPGIEQISIPSTADGSEQPMLWLPPQGDGDKPVVLILHSWSSTYLQHAGIPYAMWAQENGWAVIAPEFRGRNDDPDAIGSELAVQDVVDAIDFAIAQDGVDEERVFAVGYSGGGMMGMLIAGRYPEKVAAVAAWGPVYDLITFYGRSRAAGRHYSWEIYLACGGDPRVEGPAQDECLARSPMTYLNGAREAGVPVFIGQGLQDTLVSPRQAAYAFNQLADPVDRFTEKQIETFGRWRVPEEIAGYPPIETHFGPDDPVVLFARQSASVWIVFFKSGHEMVYPASMGWFATDPRP